MIRQRNLSVVLLSFLLVILPLTASDLSAHSGVLKKEVSVRMTLMSNMACSMDVLGKMLKKKKPFDRGKVVDAINTIEELAIKTPGAFRKKVLDTKSDAKVLVWEEFPTFTKTSIDLATRANQLSISMKSFNDLRPALITLSQGCKTCHSKFRE